MYFPSFELFSVNLNSTIWVFYEVQIEAWEMNMFLVFLIVRVWSFLYIHMNTHTTTRTTFSPTFTQEMISVIK